MTDSDVTVRRPRKTYLIVGSVRQRTKIKCELTVNKQG